MLTLVFLSETGADSEMGRNREEARERKQENKISQGS